MCCICLQCFLQYRSSIPNTPDRGITALDFIVNRGLDESATSLSASLMVSATRGLELIYSQVSAYEKQGRTIIVMKFRGYGRVKSHMPSTKWACAGVR